MAVLGKSRANDIASRFSEEDYEKAEALDLAAPVCFFSFAIGAVTLSVFRIPFSKQFGGVFRKSR